MADVIKTIGATGADYTTLAAFWTARNSNAGAGDVYIAELIDAANYPWGEVTGTFVGSVKVRAATAVKIDLTNPALPHAKITSSTTSSLYWRSLAPLVLEDLEFFTSFAASNLRLGAFEDTNVTVRRCLVRGGTTGIFHGRATATTLVENCVVTEASTWGISNGFAGITVRNTVVVDNNTSNTASRAGLRKDIAGCVLENVVAFGNLRDDIFGASTLATVSFLSSGDLDATGSNALTGVTSAAFANYAAENFTAATGGVLKGTAAGGADRGLNLSTADIIAITSPVVWQLIARNKATNTGSIPITGTYSGGTVPTSIEARWNGGAWTVITASPSGGTFSGSLTGLASGNGTLEVRYSNATSITDSVDNVAIGAKLLFWGQSNFSGRATNPQSYTGTAGFFHKYTVTNNVWAQGADPFDTDTATGSLFPLLANSLVTELGCPVAFIGVASGSTTLAQWQSGQALNTRMLNYITAAGADGLEGICSWIGESDASGATGETDFKTRYNAVIDQLETLTSVKNMLVAISGLNNTDYANVRQWINDIAATNPNASTTVPQIWPLYQKIHYETDIETAAAANAVFDGVVASFYSAAAYVLTAEGASWNYSADDASLLFGRQLAADGASWQYQDGSAGTLYNRSMQADGAAWSYAGSDATLTYTGSSAAYVMNAEGSAWSYSGADAALLNDRKLSASGASFSYYGGSASLNYSGAVSLHITGYTVGYAELPFTASYANNIVEVQYGNV